MNINKNPQHSLLIEGMLILEETLSADNVTCTLKIMDVTHIDKEAFVYAESTIQLESVDDVKQIPYKISGPTLKSKNNYIVEATITINPEGTTEILMFRTTQAIPVNEKEKVANIDIPLTKMRSN